MLKSPSQLLHKLCSPPPPPSAFVERPRGRAAFLSVCHADCCWVQYITWYGVYPWKLHWIPQTPLAGAQLDASVFTTGAIVCTQNRSHLTLCQNSERALRKGNLKEKKETYHTVMCGFYMISEHALPSSLTKQHPLKVFSFRTQGSHLLWNLIEGLFINFHSSKFLLQRKRWHTKSEDMGQLKCLFKNEPATWKNLQNSQMRK